MTLDLQSYLQHSDTMKEILSSYKSVCEQNKKLNERLSKLKMQHDKETAIAKHNQMMKADRDMQMLVESKKNAAAVSKASIPDSVLDDYEHKIVPVEFFDTLEGIDEELRGQLNYKLAKVRNNF